MNPLGWQREHQVAFVVFIGMGALIGLSFAWHQFEPTMVGAFITWLQFPGLYWPWPAFGATIAALAFYGCRLVFTEAR